MSLDKELKIFVIYVATLKTLLTEIIIYSFRAAQITNKDLMQVPALKQNEASTEVLTKYSHFINIFSEEKALVLLEQIELNVNTIKLKNGK